MNTSPWPPPEPEPCRFMLCWIGTCRATDRTQCRHGRTLVGNRIHPQFCSCGKPALGQCSMSGTFVCGAPICRSDGYCVVHGGCCEQHVVGAAR